MEDTTKAMEDGQKRANPTSVVKKMFKGDDLNGAEKVVSIVMGSIVVGAFLLITTYLGIYAFANPDSTACWVVKDLDAPMPS